jgi:hypothetical protein
MANAKLTESLVEYAKAVLQAASRGTITCRFNQLFDLCEF